MASLVWVMKANSVRHQHTPREALNDKYRIASVAEIKPYWSAVYDATCDACMHVATQGRCAAGDSCQYGRRKLRYALLTGSMIPLWDVIEGTVRKYGSSLSQAERQLKIVRVCLLEIYLYHIASV